MSNLSKAKVKIIRLAANLIKESHHAVALTGAGISTPSGIPDFRSPGSGLWTRYPPMQVASLTVFRYDPEHFYEWLHPLALKLVNAKPNAAHLALVKLQSAGYLDTIITQNIDGLHTRAGSKDVLEVHGTMSTLTCIDCFKQVPAEGILQEYISHCTPPHCQDCGGILKPDVILYEEQLPVKTWIKAEETSRKCDLMIIIGTSLEVMPSAKLPVYALEHGARLIVLNRFETYIDVRAEVVIRDDVAEIVPRIAEMVLTS